MASAPVGVAERGLRANCARMTPEARSALESEWLHLTRRSLPALALERRWPVCDDHCFQRILLDNACGGCWYDHIMGRPACRHADPAILRRALAIGRAVIDRTIDLDFLNARSRAWRSQRARVFTPR